MIAAKHGGRVAEWFEIEYTIVGGGLALGPGEVQRLPSSEAFMAVVFDPDRVAAQHDHREPAIADTYTLVTRPVVDLLAASTA